MTCPQPSWLQRLAAGQSPDGSGCHVWQRARNSRGYGVLYMEGKVRLAHRVAFFAAHGRWPASGFVLDHTCNNKACVNPDHLDETENWRNIRRAAPVGTEQQEGRREGWRGRAAKARGNYSTTYVTERVTRDSLHGIAGGESHHLVQGR